MKSIKFCILAAALCCMVPAMAQKKFGSAKYTHMCSYYGEDITGDITAFSAGPTADKVIKKIMSVIGLKANFELREANVPNAAAVMLNGKRFILYNSQFMDKINASTGTNWAAISILAHEIGHHLNGHTLDDVGSRPQTELDADEFSGFVLHKMGSSLGDAQAVMALISSPNGTKSHPPKRDRLAYIATGWNAAADVARATIAAPATTAVKPQPIAEKPVIAESTSKPTVMRSETKPKVAMPVQVNAPHKTSIAAKAPQSNAVRRSIEANVKSDVYFSSDPNGEYYLTSKGNLVQVQNDKVYLVGSLYRSDRQGYTMMFAGDNADKIYVAGGGNLVNGQGKKIGFMKSR
ncbi:hypothetical protein [Flavobacterium psychrotrophum]|uniref:hypothetical protein n=1 Tax=Flavobacterium psychrotrophum TaxID=2294119 RepID=UPI000E319A54|nr:hypothetical protein [Flavobacterium psychrotrophum]